jgi:integrase
LGNIKLSKLTPEILNRWYRQWAADGLSPTSVHHLHAILSAALNQAVKWGWIPSSPTARATAPPLRTKALKIPSPEELNKIHRAAQDTDPVVATAVALAALTGARRGELCALRWSDIDMVTGRVTFARSLTTVKGTPHEGATKTHQVRAVALDETAITVLRQRWDDMRDLSERAGSPLVGDPYVLSYNANGATHVGPDTITHGFADVNRRLGLSYRFHDLRHFSVTTLIAAGVDVRTVAERHGHAQATMTLNRYAHALPERDREAAQVLGGTVRLGR